MDRALAVRLDTLVLVSLLLGGVVTTAFFTGVGSGRCSTRQSSAGSSRCSLSV